MTKRRKPRSRKRKAVKEAQHHSYLWYLLPILLGILGGLIGYFLLRSKDRQMANRLLIWGIIFMIVSLAFQSMWAVFGGTDFFEVTRETQSLP